MFCGRGIMVARQLPKLKTRVRFPSPAPRIQPVLYRFNYWLCSVGIEPDQEGSGRQLTRTSVYEVRVLRSERDPWSENEHGNIHSLRPHQEFNRHFADFIFGLWRGRDNE